MEEIESHLFSQSANLSYNYTRFVWSNCFQKWRNLPFPACHRFCIGNKGVVCKNCRKEEPAPLVKLEISSSLCKQDCLCDSRSSVCDVMICTDL